MSAIQIKSIGKDVYELPDGSVAYTMKKAIQQYKKIRPIKYTVTDLILFVFYAQENVSIRGRTLLFKEIFYFEQEFFNRKILENCRFVPYYYGPYSFHVAHKLQYLISVGVIEKIIKGNGKIVDEYKLTTKGKRLIKNKYNKLNPKLRSNLEEARKGLDQHGSKILKAIYKREKYSKYILKSKVSYRYKLISWGKKI